MENENFESMRTLHLCFFILLPFLIKSQPKIYETIHLKAEIKIDGKIDEQIWQKINWDSSFVQIQPKIGSQPSEKTSFAVFYDDKYIYIAIKAYERDIKKINRQMSSRDEMVGDLLNVIFDSYNDKRTGFCFAVSAAGIKNDFIFFNDGDKMDFSWNPIWDVATSIENGFWVAEMKIPFSQLRYSVNSNSWGFNVVRYISRYNEQSAWSFIDFSQKGFISQLGTLAGFYKLKSHKYFEIAPYSMIGLKSTEPSENNFYPNGKQILLNAGLDGKISLTNDIFLSFTINPDFGQIEADPSELNLTAYETYFEEKREFFVEGQNIFLFPISFDASSLFYSRRIGANPTFSPSVGDKQKVLVPTNTPIAYAMKISGKTQNGLSLGFLEAFTPNTYAKIKDSNNTVSKQIVEPATNYFVGRIQKDYNDGKTIIGAIITNTSRFVTSDYKSKIHKNATTWGLDFTHYFANQKYFFEFKYAGSALFGNSAPLLEIQKRPQRYLQNPDIKYFSLDSTSKKLLGSYINLKLGKSAIAGLRYATLLFFSSPLFETNDIGYLRYTNYLALINWIGYTMKNSTKLLNSFSINFNQWTGFDKGLNLIFNGLNTNFNLQLQNLWSFGSYIEINFPYKSKDLLRGGPFFLVPSSLNFNFWFSSNNTKKFVLRTNFMRNLGKFNFENTIKYSISIEFKPNTYLSISPQFIYTDMQSKLQYLSSSDKYYLSSLTQQIINFTLRINFNLSPNFVIQYYGSPFSAIANYFDPKIVVDPNNKDFFRRTASTTDFNYDLNDFDISFAQFRSNFVIRYEFFNNSAIYFVWSHEQTFYENSITKNNLSLLQKLFTIYPTDILMFKIQLRFI